MSRYIPRKSNYNKNDLKAVVKGSNETLRVDKVEIETILKQLRVNEGIIVSQANKTLTTYLARIQEYAKQFHGTSSYKDFYTLVIDIFGDVQEVMPGTISAFLIGYHQFRGNVSNKKYAATCVNAIPSLNIDKYPASCDKTVLIIYRDTKINKSYIKPINIATTNRSKLSYIYVMSDISNTEDIKLTDTEISSLKSYDIKDYELYTYMDGIYKFIRKDAIGFNAPLQMVRRHENSHKSSSSGVVYVTILLSVFLVLLILYISIVRK